ncbi:hypothetical protein [Microlunatus parietis]|uniref:Copper(I)-binding protein n=1 Tax=Microlunatus parietis TaxID=682979 RepID=A0A7Y9IAW0_9ACTN|nr:hypothetical protein [Microlunatus parietis]NYE73300.1 hypothetical protein [Microlunatus parietis]
MPSSVPFASLSSATRPRRLARAGAAMILAAALSLAAGCGFDVQTNRPYTPGEGINANVGPRSEPVGVRNLLIVSKEPGQGFVSASLTATRDDVLQRITGRAYRADGSAGTPLAATLPAPVTVEAGTLTVLTSERLIEVTGDDLRAGLEAELTLTFATAGEVTLRVPVVTADDPQFATISPSPSASPSPTASN